MLAGIGCCDRDRLARLLASSRKTHRSRPWFPSDPPSRSYIASEACGWMSRSVRRVLSPRAVAGTRLAVIHLGYSLPSTSSGLPASSGGPPSNACCSTLLQVGFT